MSVNNRFTNATAAKWTEDSDSRLFTPPSDTFDYQLKASLDVL